MSYRPAALFACFLALFLAAMPVARAMTPAATATAAAKLVDGFGFEICQPGAKAGDGTNAPDAHPGTLCDHCLTLSAFALSPTDADILTDIDRHGSAIAWLHRSDDEPARRWSAAQARAPPRG
ncbi:MAG: hypothetical protein ACK50Q_03395 [Labrys sp. (in: a-proteobacteria)]|jgi:hypothetical protein